MAFKLCKRKVMFRIILIISIGILTDYLLRLLGDSFGRSFNLILIIVMTCHFIYSTFRNNNEVYVIKNDLLVLKNMAVEIPISEIKEIECRRAPILHYSGITNEGMGVQYYVLYKDCAYELMTTSKNEFGESINEVLHKEYEIDYKEI